MNDDIFDEIGRAAESGGGRVRLDFANVRFMTSALIEKLVRANKKAKSAGVELVLANVSPNVREVFRVTKLGERFHFE